MLDPVMNAGPGSGRSVSVERVTNRTVADGVGGYLVAGFSENPYRFSVGLGVGPERFGPVPEGVRLVEPGRAGVYYPVYDCLLYTSDAADE